MRGAGRAWSRWTARRHAPIRSGRCGWVLLIRIIHCLLLRRILNDSHPRWQAQFMPESNLPPPDSSAGRRGRSARSRRRCAIGHYCAAWLPRRPIHSTAHSSRPARHRCCGAYALPQTPAGSVCYAAMFVACSRPRYASDHRPASRPVVVSIAALSFRQRHAQAINAPALTLSHHSAITELLQGLPYAFVEG